MKDIKALKSRIAERVTLGDMLVQDGKISGALSEEQYSCNFHGKDRKKSARYYRDTDSSYCWVCKKRWDIYSYLSDKEGLDFWHAVAYLIKSYGIPTRDLPDAFEEAHKKRVESPKFKIDDFKISQEKLSNAVRKLRSSISDEKYEKLVFAIMILKYVMPEEKKIEGSEVLRKAILKIVEETKNVR